MLKIFEKKFTAYMCLFFWRKLNVSKGNVCVDVIILDPKWLCYTVLGTLLSPEFIKKSRPTGYYATEELRTATNWDTIETMLPILESLGLCAKVSIHIILT